MATIALVVSICAALVQILGYYLYVREVFSDNIRPNAVSWLLWGIGSALAAWSYVSLSEDWVKDILPVTCATVCFVVFLLMLAKGKCGMPDAYDVFICVLDLGIIGFWYLTDSDEYTNLFFQADAILSFLPIIRGTWKDPSSEKPAPWFVWSSAYVLLAAVVLMRFEKWWDLMYPLNYLGLHLIIAFVAWRKQPAKSNTVHSEAQAAPATS